MGFLGLQTVGSQIHGEIHGQESYLQCVDACAGFRGCKGLSGDLSLSFPVDGRVGLSLQIYVLLLGKWGEEQSYFLHLLLLGCVQLRIIPLPVWPARVAVQLPFTVQFICLEFVTERVYTMSVESHDSCHNLHLEYFCPFPPKINSTPTSI